MLINFGYIPNDREFICLYDLQIYRSFVKEYYLIGTNLPKKSLKTFENQWLKFHLIFWMRWELQ